MPSKLFKFLIHYQLDAVKPSTCVYSGYFLIRYMQGVRKDSDKMESFKSSYCDKYREALPSRTAFIKKIKPLEGSEYDFKCAN